MKRMICMGLLPVLFALVAAGCGREQATTEPEAAAGGGNADGSAYRLASQPEGSIDVIKARKTAKDGDDVVVVGRIGGSPTPLIKGVAAFSIVDTSLKSCSDIPGDTCPTPWDYCCESDVSKSKVLVKFVDKDGRPVKTGARELLKVKELQTVVVKGKAKRDDAGNLTILASGIYVKK